MFRLYDLRVENHKFGLCWWFWILMIGLDFNINFIFSISEFEAGLITIHYSTPSSSGIITSVLLAIGLKIINKFIHSDNKYGIWCLMFDVWERWDSDRNKKPTWLVIIRFDLSIFEILKCEFRLPVTVLCSHLE